MQTHFQQTTVENCVRVFPNNDLSSIFIAINQRVLKEYFAWKQSEMDRNSQKYLKRRKSQAQFCLHLGWLDISETRIIEKCNYVGAGTHNVEKVVSFWPIFEANFTHIWGG